jgi:ATP-dependent DNA helicase DinG
MGNILTAKAITFLDVETSHLDPKKSAILQISIITDWEDGNQDVWTTRIQPRDLEVEFASPEALKICNYNYDQWNDAPFFEDVAPTIAKKLAWGPIVAHNAQFDVAHLKSSFERRGWREPQRNEKFDASKKMFKIGYPVIDTCALAYMFLPTERQNLNALREHFNIDTNRAHSADTDVEDCRTVFYNIIESVNLKGD